MKAEIRDGIQESNLPAAVKDQYADAIYDPQRPYDQSVGDIVRSESLSVMLRTLQAASRALRNSDYVAPHIKRELLQAIFSGWEQVTKVLLVLMPLLVEKGRASFGGAVFLVQGKFSDSPAERLSELLQVLPWNVAVWFQDDLFSQKMGPLLIDQCKAETDELRKHEAILLLIMQRPRDWRQQVQNYIASVSKNSFFLLDVYSSLQREYRYAYASTATLRDIEYLIKMAAVKHVTGSKEPGPKQIASTKLVGEVIPPREVNDS
jgi:hypothetical protein